MVNIILIRELILCIHKEYVECNNSYKFHSKEANTHCYRLMLTLVGGCIKKPLQDHDTRSALNVFKDFVSIH
jgi:hypothetical protein